MKNHQLLRGSSAGLSAFIQVNTAVGFLLAREQAVGMEPMGPAGGAGYVWRRVFLKGKGGARD